MRVMCEGCGEPIDLDGDPIFAEHDDGAWHEHCRNLAVYTLQMQGREEADISGMYAMAERMS